jgi:predicted dehydrogenase
MTVVDIHIALVRKAPQVYTDISALHFRPWRFWQAMVTALEYGISHKILFGSDFPNASTADTIEGLHRVNDIVEGTRFPRVPEDVQERIVHENPALARSPAFDLAAVVDAREAARTDAARRSGAPAYPTLAAALVTQPDAIVVATPPEVTPAITREGIERGLAVLCEKPMAVDAFAARAVHEAAVRSDALVQVGFTNRFSPLVEELRARVADLGTPLVYALGAYDERYDPADTRHLERITAFLAAGPAFVHEGAHLTDYVRYLGAGRPRRVSAAGVRSRPEFPSENWTAAVVEYDTGDVARLEVGWLLPALPPGHFRVMGPEGSAEIERRHGRMSFETAAGREVIELPRPWDEITFARQLDRFGAAVRGEAEVDPDTADGVASLELSEAIVTAMRTGTSVELAGAAATAY